MNYRPKITPEVAGALKAANRTPGWNSRPPTVKAFEIGFEPGRCKLYVPNYSFWAYARQRKQMAAWSAGERQA